VGGTSCKTPEPNSLVSPPRRPRQRLAKASLLASSLLLTFAASELALRLLGSQPRTATVLSTYFEHDPATGWTGRAGAAARFVTSSFDVEITHGPDGFRASERTHEPKTNAGDEVVWCLGDSCVWGWGIADGQTFVDVLNRNRDDKRVFRNLGVTGYGTLQEYLLLEKLLASESAPSQVLVTFCGNDLTDNLDEHGRPHLRRSDDGFVIIPGAAPSAARRVSVWLTRHSLVCNYLNFYLISAKTALSTRHDNSRQSRENRAIAAAPPGVDSPNQSLQWQAIEHCYCLMQDLCRRHGIELSIVWQFETPVVEPLAELAQRHSLRLIDLSSAIRQQRDLSNITESLQFERDPHYNELGHEMIGRGLADRLAAIDVARLESGENHR
jgi:lysophospholipase L1-like esterase